MQRLETYFESNEYKKQATKDYLVLALKDEKGAYRQSFRTEFINFSQHTKSLRAASKGFESVLKALGIYDDDTKRCVPVRATTTLWRQVESEVQTDAYVGKLKMSNLFGLNCDGSERGDKNVFVIRGFFWSEQEHRPHSIVLAVLDMQSKKSAEDMLHAIVWALTDKHGLRADQLLMCMSDNTNSMSGKWNGVFAQLARHMKIENNFPRLACILHVLHLGYAAIRPVMWGPMPKRNDRSYGHFWNFLWDLWMEFGAANPLWDELVRVCQEAGLPNLEKTWKPVASRWLYEQYAVRWYFIHQTHIARLCEVYGESSARWRRIRNYRFDPWINAQALAMVYLSEEYMRPMQRMMQTDETPRLFRTTEAEGETLPCGFRCHKLLEIYHSGLIKLTNMASNKGPGMGMWWYDSAVALLRDVKDPDKQPSVLLRRVVESAHKMKQLWRKWTEPVTAFPFLTFSLGGDLGPHFAYALVTEVILKNPGRFPLTSEQQKLAVDLAAEDKCNGENELVTLWRTRICEHIRSDAKRTAKPTVCFVTASRPSGRMTRKRTNAAVAKGAFAFWITSRRTRSSLPR